MLGPSGCGKSTLLRAVAGLERPDHGTVTVDGQDVSRVPAYRRGFALMFQDGQLFGHLTVAENVAYPLRLRAGRPPTGAGAPGWPSCSSWSGVPGPRGARPRDPVRRRAAAGRPGPRAGGAAAAAAARRAAVGARPGPARAAGRRPARHPHPGRHDGAAGDPRPRRGLRRRRPDGAAARGTAGPGRHGRGGLAPPRRTPRPPASSATPACSTADQAPPRSSGRRDAGTRGPRRRTGRALALRRSALQVDDTGPLTRDVVSQPVDARADPARRHGSTTGSELDAVAPAGRAWAAGERVRLRLDVTRIASPSDRRHTRRGGTGAARRPAPP